MNVAYPAVAVNVIILREQEVLLTKRADVALWCLPGGMVERGETIVQAMRREVREEIGCEVRIGELVGVYSAPNVRLTPPAQTMLIVVAAVATIMHGSPGISAEVLESGYFGVSTLPEMVPNQMERIVHALDGLPARLL